MINGLALTAVPMFPKAGQPLATSVWASLDDVLGTAAGPPARVHRQGNNWHNEHAHTECVEYDGGAIRVH
jgi:hypothetical protein